MGARLEMEDDVRRGSSPPGFIHRRRRSARSLLVRIAAFLAVGFVPGGVRARDSPSARASRFARLRALPLAERIHSSFRASPPRTVASSDPSGNTV